MRYIFALAASFIFAVSTSGAIINVPSDYDTVQGAVDAAVDGDEVVVAPGTWIGSIDMLGKAITLRSSGGPAVTALEGVGSQPVVTCATGEEASTVIEGFTMHGDPGGGILIDHASPIFRECVIEDCWAGDVYLAAALDVFGGSPQLELCTIRDHGQSHDGLRRVIEVTGATVTFSACTIERNRIDIHSSSAVVWVQYGVVTFDHCLFTDNQNNGGAASNERLLYATDYSILVLQDCQVHSNEVRFVGATWYSRLTAESCQFDENGVDPDDGTLCNQAILHAGSWSSLEVQDCQFNANRSMPTASSNPIWVSQDVLDIEIVNCTFTANEGQSMIYFDDVPTNEGAHIQGCTFMNNFGRAIDSEARIVIADCYFEGNRTATDDGGGAIYAFNGLVVERCIFVGNQAEGTRGGAIAAQHQITIRDCDFDSNLALGDGGGAIWGRGPLLISGCDFTGNESLFGGAIAVVSPNSPGTYVMNCRFLNNAAGTGGAMWLFRAGAEVANCLIVGCRAESWGGAVMTNGFESSRFVNCTLFDNAAFAGGALYNLEAESAPEMMNCIVHGNTTSGFGSDIDGVVPPLVSYSLIEDGYPGEGNLDADPLFANAGDGDYWLTAQSPAVDSGLVAGLSPDLADLDDDGDTQEAIPLDLDFLERVVDGDGNKESVVDMGCYEYDPSFNGCAADIDGNGAVEFGDLLALLATWGTCEACPSDIDGDGEVGFGDLIILLAAWGPCPEGD